ncbi:MAG: imidazole glycerol phosphate synthase subunit HisH [Nitrospira sp.]
MTIVAIIDYGMGNLRSVQKAFETVGHAAVVTRDPRTIKDADRVVLPGVGAFADCMANLEKYGLVEPIRSTIAAGKPFLGICLGLQLLFTESEEFGVHKGLDVLPGKVVRFSSASNAEKLKVPHMGWNGVVVQREAPPLTGIASGEPFYFVHSYCVEPRDRAVVATMTDYGAPFVSSVWKDNIFACQFHPEKSQAAGLRLIKNFGAWRT